MHINGWWPISPNVLLKHLDEGHAKFSMGDIHQFICDVHNKQREVFFPEFYPGGKSLYIQWSVYIYHPWHMADIQLSLKEYNMADGVLTSCLQQSMVQIIIRHASFAKNRGHVLMTDFGLQKYVTKIISNIKWPNMKVVRLVETINFGVWIILIRDHMCSLQPK